MYTRESLYLLVCNTYVETNTAFAMPINTWWFKFFAWSLRSSVPFSGYVNTEETRGSRSFMDPATVFWKHDWKLGFLLPVTESISLLPLPGSQWPSLPVVCGTLPGSPCGFCAACSVPSHPCTRLHWHILSLAWQLRVYNWEHVSLGSVLRMNRNRTLWCIQSLVMGRRVMECPI